MLNQGRGGRGCSVGEMYSLLAVAWLLVLFSRLPPIIVFIISNQGGGGYNIVLLFRMLMVLAAFRHDLNTPSRNRVIRSPFGGKRCIVDRLPLPPCCANGYCVAHLERPTLAACGRAPDEDLKMSALTMVFLQHDANGSGTLYLLKCTHGRQHSCCFTPLVYSTVLLIELNTGVGEPLLFWLALNLSDTYVYI